MTDEQFETIKKAYDGLLKGLERMKRQAKDVMDYPDEDNRESLPYLLNSVMDSAHEIIDLAHEFKQATNLKKA